MEGKIIKCCGDCAHYDFKKHKCRNGHKYYGDPRKHFYSDCKTLEDLSEHDKQIRADAIDEYVKFFIENALIDESKTWTEYARKVAKQLKEQK